MRFVAEFGIDPFYIMIVHEIVKLQSLWTVAAHLIETFYRMGNLLSLIHI